MYQHLHIHQGLLHMPHPSIEKTPSNLQYLTQIVENDSNPGNVSGNSGMVHLAEIKPLPPTQCCSILAE